MDKQLIIESLKQQLRDQYDRTLAALQDAAEGATGDDTKAESKYDTRGLESSYLAAGQAEQAERLQKELSAMESFEFPNFTQSSAIAPGALVEAIMEGKPVYYLLAPAGGGLSVETSDGNLVTILGSSAPLRGRMLDLKIGDTIEQPPLEIKSIQ